MLLTAENPSLFKRFKDSARLKHLDPLDISRNYQCPIYVYELPCDDSTYLLCNSPIDFAAVLDWIKQQELVSEYKVRLNEVEGRFTKSKSVFISDVRSFDKLVQYNILSELLKRMHFGLIKMDETDIYKSWFECLNNMQLSFNFLPNNQFKPIDLRNMERDRSMAFGYHWNSIWCWKNKIFPKFLIRNSKVYGLTKFVLPSEINYKPENFDQLPDILEKDVLLVLRPINNNFTFSGLYEHLSKSYRASSVKLYRAIMFNVDQFLLDMNNITDVPGYEEEVKRNSDILEFKRQFSYTSSFRLAGNRDRFRLIRIPQLLLINLSSDRNFFETVDRDDYNYGEMQWAKCVILSTLSGMKWRTVLDEHFSEGVSSQEVLVNAHRPENIDNSMICRKNDHFLLAFGEHCPDFNLFRQAYQRSSHINDSQLNHYRSKGIIITAALKRESSSVSLLKAMKGFHDPQSYQEVYTVSKIEIPRHDDDGYDIMLIFKPANMNMLALIHGLISSSFFNPVKVQEFNNECCFLYN